ncbi:M23 family metallopeptidase [Nereida sp. MMG025]|uniref:M23 family metallopeptidase n=1 Tax=Nereida sp. MMG025 TaxID=2909981 RepID=UPI001F2E92C1|nr:M23 family metallopeptidase [Nereida sp. MMG025]MCF6444116.1 M23 family metallopeptidase [Nereida sp. MMG025]
MRHLIRYLKGAALAALFAGTAHAREPLLNLPLDCTLGDTCYIQQYVDRDPSAGVSDFACGTLSYDTHKGTDFALPSLQAMDNGVDVLAAAPGTVVAFRDGVPDQIYTSETAAQVDGIECGNGVVVDHGAGWRTQYCHLKEGSVIVENGQRVAKGAVLGEVGLSGRTQFPHLHIVVRQGDRVVDPFHPDPSATCSLTPQDTMWQTPIEYVPAGLIAAGFSTAVPDYDRVKAGDAAAATLRSSDPAIVLWGYAFGARQGDVLSLTITGPAGVLIEHKALIKRDQAQLMRAAGKPLRGVGWPKGRYKGTASLTRQGDILDTMETTIEVE